MLRAVMLSFAGSKRVEAFMRKTGMSSGFARRFVAGEDLAEAVRAVNDLNADGVLASLDFLGERVADAAESRRVSQRYLEILDAINQHALRCDVSLKLTQLGLDIGEAVAEENMRRIADRARELGNFIRIDMENSPYTDRTLRIYEALHREFGGCVGAVIQSYLRRSMTDVMRLLPLRPNLRLCKGAYQESPEVAFPLKADVDRNYIALLETLLVQGGYTAIATHDERIIRYAEEFTRRRSIARERFEFQMLYGVRRDLQSALARQGFRVRVYIPYGREWYPYLMRRLGERPANLWFVVRNLLRELSH
jgi:proline dehydrogenase